MKKVIKFSLLSFLMAVVCGFTSCDEEDVTTTTTTTVLPHVEFNLPNLWPYVANGEYLTMDLEIDREKSSAGVKIVSVEYTFDGQHISTTTVAPFSLKYLIQNKSVGTHTLGFKVKVGGGDNYSDATFDLHMDVHVLDEPFALNIGVKFDNETFNTGSELIVSNGDIISGTVNLHEGNTVDGIINRLEVYWDDTLYDATSVSPFSFSFPVNNASIGQHELRVSTLVDTEYGGFTQNRRYQFNVVE